MPEIEAGLTVPELARVLRVSADKIRLWIGRGELKALNVGLTLSGRPRYVVLPEYLAEFEKRRTAGRAPKPTSRKKRTEEIDFYPD